MKNLLSLMIFKVLILASVLAKADIPAIHGMLLFGDENNYASHLPMFHSPHDYQLIMKINLQGRNNSSALASYQEAKAAGKYLFTLVPERMDLTSLIEGHRHSFKAMIYEGHFERGGKVLGAVHVTVDQLIYSQKLKAISASSEDEHYLVFGEKNEYFAFHQIVGRPSFDAILKVKQPYKVRYRHCGRGHCPDPIVELVPEEKLSQIKVTTSGIESDPEELKEGMTIGAWNGVMLDILKVLYIEKSDLQ